MKTLSQVFYISESHHPIPTDNSFNPPRCHTISYWDIDDNICQECFDADPTVQELKDYIK